MAVKAAPAALVGIVQDAPSTVRSVGPIITEASQISLPDRKLRFYFRLLPASRRRFPGFPDAAPRDDDFERLSALPAREGRRRRCQRAAARFAASRADRACSTCRRARAEAPRADVGAHVARCDSAVQQRANGLRQPIERIGVELRSAVHGERQRRDMPFFVATSSTLDVKPAPKASTGAVSAASCSRQLAELIHLATINCLEQGLARREVAIERPDADPGRPRDGLEARVRSARAEHGLRGLEQPLAITHRVRAGPPRPLLWIFRHPSI